ncbi:uncharacterized protein ARMOST_08374 [Armillaria ostoyae]|uniref:Uncharacterized protein n=1 Tax=Armillaria ostoyae TaxID=47428 RepID=A0A284R8I9_ARMOS|nr:uncharacterized protein ARMOST_08374 [Armillaria ostoyae]
MTATGLAPQIIRLVIDRDGIGDEKSLQGPRYPIQTLSYKTMDAERRMCMHQIGSASRNQHGEGRCYEGAGWPNVLLLISIDID